MTADAVVEQTCPRCGSNAAGAPWCPSCGLNLRLHSAEPAASPPPPPPPLPPAPAAAQHRPPRTRLIALIVGGVLVLGGAITAIALLAFHSSSAPTAAATTVIQTVAVTNGGVTTTPRVSSPLVTVSDIHDVLVAYVSAYSNEDAPALGRLFAADLVRQNGTDPIEDRNAALVTYQQQFDQLTNPQYTLGDIRYDVGQGQASAAGTYVITSAAGRTSGSIEFHFVVRGGRLLIDAIAVTPA